MMKTVEPQDFFRIATSECSNFLPWRRSPDFGVMSIGEGANQPLDSERHNQFRQITVEPAQFFSSASQHLAASQQQIQASTINYCSFVQSPEHQGIPINYQSHNYHHRSHFPCHPNSGGTISVSENDSAVQLSADHSNPNHLNDLDFKLMNIDPNMSPSSGITSPMDLGFPNISDEQSIDNTDLNNITPSIKLASSLNLLGPSDFSPGGGNASGSGGGSSNRRSKPLIKSDNLSKGEGTETSGFGAKEMPSTSCPAENSGAAYLASGGLFESPSGALTIPCTGGGGGGGGGTGGNASGGSGASSVTGTWGGSSLASLSGAPNLTMLSSNAGGNDNQRVAMIRARSKKDSHNRIERKRRDYINCQITELGTLLPEEMFRENDCKKNKGSILKNSVEYISALQRENQCYAGLYNEATLANTVIDRMMKRIQALESILPKEYLAKVTPTGGADYRQMLQEWSKLHDINQQKISSGAAAAANASAPPGGGIGQVSVDTSESSPGMSSVGNNDDVGTYLDARGDSNSPVPLVGRPGGRTRCTSTSSTSGQPAGLGIAGGTAGGMEGTPLGGPPLVGSLPSRGTRGTRILPTNSPPNPAQVSGRLLQMRPLFTPLYASSGPGTSGGAGAKHPSPPSGRMTGKRTAAGRPPPTKLEESGDIAVPKQNPLFSPNISGNAFGSANGSGFGLLSTSLPVRMAPDDFSSTSEMNTDEPYLQMTPDSGEGAGCQEGMAVVFKPEPMVEMPCNPPTSFHSHSYQPQFSGGSGGPTIQSVWGPRLSRPLSAGKHQQAPTEASPGQQTSGMADELQFDHAM